jgi:heterodisulfide reductase subunit B
MKYIYYPGCSLERNAAAYEKSLLAIAPMLGLEFEEVEDWNCCGATEYFSLNKLGAYALVARNLALAAKQKQNGHELVAPCSACFLNLSKADHYFGESIELSNQINVALDAGGLSYEPGSVRTRHLLPVVVDAGLETIKDKVTKRLNNLRVAPYYGCLIVRPDYPGDFENHEHPRSLDDLVEALGATIVDFPMRTQCCGGHMTQISEDTALEMIRRLLKNVQDTGADMIVTLCPKCQWNLDAYQEAVNRKFNTDFRLPILYFTQLMGLAFGLPMDDLGFGLEFVSAKPALEKITDEPDQVSKKARRAKAALPWPGEG